MNIIGCILNTIGATAGYATAAPKAVEAAPVAIQMSDTTAESSYFLARIMMDLCHWLLRIFGLQNNSDLFIFLYIGLVFLFSMAVGMLLQWIVVLILHKLQPHIKGMLYGLLVERKFFTKACRILPPIIFLILIQFTLYMHNSL